MNEIYIVLQMEGVEPKICDVWDSLASALEEFELLVQEQRLQPIAIDSEGIKNEIQGTIAVAGDDACSVQVLKRSVHHDHGLSGKRPIILR